MAKVAMKNRGQKIGLTIAAMMVFAIIAFFSHDTFLRFVLSQFDDLNVQFQVRSLTEPMGHLFTFMSVISMLPGLFLFSHFILKDQKPKVFLLIVPITFLFGIAMIALHIYSIRTEMLEFELPYFIKDTYSFSIVHAERY